MTQRSTTASEPAVVVLPNQAAVSLEAAARTLRILGAAIAARGRADLATTGGSTPIGIYGHLASPELRDQIDWRLVHIWFGDDRFVPRDHPLSNVLPVDQVLVTASAHAGMSGDGAAGIDVQVGAVSGAPVPPGNIHPFPCSRAIAESRDAAWCAAAYGDELRGAVTSSPEGWPIFDLVLVGIGPDGHVLSVFPNSAALSATDLALAIPAPTHVEPHVERVTLNPRILEVARDLLAITHGAGKAEIVGTIFGDVRDPNRWPAQLARRPGVTWLMDAEAAARLPSGHDAAGDG